MHTLQIRRLVFPLVLLTMSFGACKPAVDYKEKREEVIKLHDVVMGDAGNVVDKQSRLQGMLKDLRGLKLKYPNIDTLKEKDSIDAVNARLEAADDAMNDWMHHFEPDVTGKSNEEAVHYFEAEKLKIQKVDSLFKREIKSADAYLAKFNK
jgi:hypothetical protein